MNFSYWDLKELIGPVDYLIIGSGITGLSTGIFLREAMPQKHVVILERGMMPWGASTRNAGFACFGSMGELVSDLQRHSEKEVLELLEKRIKGLELLKSMVGVKQLQYEDCGNFEVFQHGEEEHFQNLLEKIPGINKMLRSLFESEVFCRENNSFGLANTIGVIKNRYEGMLNTGRMMNALLKKAQLAGVRIYNGAQVSEIKEGARYSEVYLQNGLRLKAQKVALCTNAFSNQLKNKLDVQPARNQVLITEPLAKVPFKGAFHMEEGYVYFRNVGNRVLLGGGRQHFPEENNTQEILITDAVQAYLEEILQTVILPQHKFKVEQRWAGIIGVGEKKTPIVQRLSSGTFAAVRLGGMGVALGSLLGKELAQMIIADN